MYIAYIVETVLEETPSCTFMTVRLCYYSDLTSHSSPEYLYRCLLD